MAARRLTFEPFVFEEADVLVERRGWVREAYYRRSWPAADGSLQESVSCAIWNDRRSGETTPVPPGPEDEGRFRVTRGESDA